MAKKNRAAVTLGRRGGKAKSERKSEAARQNGRRGGRPKKTESSVEAVMVDWSVSVKKGAIGFHDARGSYRRNQDKT